MPLRLGVMCPAVAARAEADDRCGMIRAAVGDAARVVRRVGRAMAEGEITGRVGDDYPDAREERERPITSMSARRTKPSATACRRGPHRPRRTSWQKPRPRRQRE